MHLHLTEIFQEKSEAPCWENTRQARHLAACGISILLVENPSTTVKGQFVFVSPLLVV
jgi:hypothetical protein